MFLLCTAQLAKGPPALLELQHRRSRAACDVQQSKPTMPSMNAVSLREIGGTRSSDGEDEAQQNCDVLEYGRIRRVKCSDEMVLNSLCLTVTLR